MRLVKTIRGRVLSLAGFSILTGLLAVTLTHLALSAQNLTELMYTRSELIAQSLRAKLDQLFRIDMGLVEISDFEVQCSEMLSAYPELSNVRVVDRRGLVLFAGTNTLRQLDLPAELAKAKPGDNTFHVTAQDATDYHLAIPIFYKDDYQGAVVVSLPKRAIDSRQFAIIANSLIFSLPLEVTLLGLLLYGLYRWVTRPIALLTESVSHFGSSGELVMDSGLLTTNSELGLLARAFDTMATDLKQSRAELDTHLADLERTVASRTAQLNEVNDSLRQHIRALIQAKEDEDKLREELDRSRKMEAIGNLASGVAHDLNNILSGFVSYPDIIMMDMADDDPTRKPLMAIKKSGERAAALVQDLLTIARRGVSTQTLLEPRQLFEDLQASPELVQLGQQFPKVAIRFELADSVARIRGVAFHVLKALSNLIANAAEAIGDSGEVVVSVRSVELLEDLAGYEQVPAGSWVVFAVQDNGSGIEQAQISRIFEPFYTKKALGRRSGTGLGMTVVYNTMRDHQGYIDVRSRLQEGTTFCLYFPATNELAPIEIKGPVSGFRGQGETILVIDDLSEQLELMETLLTSLGYSPVLLPSGEVALEWLRNNEPDLVLLDMHLDAGLNGVETVERMFKIRPGIRIIINTGYAEAAQIQEAQRLGVVGYIKKPATVESLGLAIRNALKGT